MSNATAMTPAPPFFDPFACMEAALAGARRRNKLAVRARKEGRHDDASEHQEMVHFYMGRVHEWHGMIDWSVE